MSKSIVSKKIGAYWEQAFPLDIQRVCKNFKNLIKQINQLRSLAANFTF